MSLGIPRSALLASACFALVFGVAAVALGQQPSQTRQFPPGAWSRLEDLPASRLRAQIERLPASAQQRALAWLQGFHFTELDLNSLQVDADGAVYYADVFALEAVPPQSEPTPPVSEAAVPVSPFPASLVFHSRPGAPNVLYINFTGESVSGTAWNTSLNRTVIPAVAFSTDGDYSTFSDAEQVAIKRIWQRMAEDYAPFNVDVTTERPATFNTRTAHALITRNTDANNAANPSSSAGGVAYVNVFATSSYANYRPAWIYFNNLADDESYIAEAASHEIGHNLGLSHDGRNGGIEYYTGHGSGDTSWGPLMGTGYDRNVSQWSKGEYYQANNTEDDVAIIAAKISYRTDDHGNTPGTATALVIADGTNIVSTTPENDPTNTNPANKGVLERNTDVDVFSFVSGTGPVNLTVKPWIMPPGVTHGGNLDVRLELYDQTGALLLTDNPASETVASIQTNLAEGNYFLYVRNTGVGNPLSSNPSGYTSYASIGQYFISGYVVASGFVAPPVAESQVNYVTLPGQGPKQFTVTYSDNLAIDVATIDNNDIRITGPHGYDRAAQFISVNVTGNGTPRLATYAADPPAGGIWTMTDNGTYTIWIQTHQVGDTEGGWVVASQLGQFEVKVPLPLYTANMSVNPGWTLEPLWQYGPPSYSGVGPTSGFTGANILGYNLSGNYENRLATKYATTPPINCSGSSSLTLRFRRWLRLRSNDTALIQASTNGTTWANVWSTSSAVTDNAWQEVQYTLPAGFAGSPFVRLRWSLASNTSQNDIGWNIDDVELLGNGTLDTIPPNAVLDVADIVIGGSPSHSLSIAYTDDSAVSVASLGSSDVLVTGPNGYSNLVEFVGADLPSDGTPRTATYSIPAPGGLWDPADNGVYQVALQEGEVEDIFHNGFAQTALGSFTVAIPTSQQALVINPTSLTVREGSNTVFTVGLAEQPSAPITVTVAWVSGQTNLFVQTGGTNQFDSTNWSTPVPVTIAALPDPDQVNGTAVFHCIAEGLVTVTVLATEQDTISGSLAVTPAQDFAASGTVGGPFTHNSVSYTLTNAGGSSLNWTLTKTAGWFTLSANAGTLVAGVSTNVTVSLNATATTLAVGSYTDTLGFTNTTTGAGNTSRSVSLTVNAASGELVVTPENGFIAGGPVGGPFTPASVSYTLTNAGGSSLNWTVTKMADWFTLSADTGTLPAGASTNVTVSLNAMASTLVAGSYADTLGFTNTTPGGGNTKRSVSLTVNVAPGELVVTPENGLSASGAVGGPFTPNSVSYTLTNVGSSSLNWTATMTAGWFTLSASAGTLPAGASTNVTISLNATATALAVGSYTDTLGFANTTAGAGDTNRTVSLTVNAAPGELAVTPENGFAASGTVGGPFTPNSLSYMLTNVGGSSLNWTVTQTASWFTLSANAGTLAAGTSTNVTVSLNATATALAVGSYTDTLGFTNTTAGAGDTNRTVSLTVNPISGVHLTVNVNNPAWGTVSPSNSTNVTGSLVQVTAIPATYFRFNEWTGDAVGADNPLALVLGTNLSVLAVFGEILTTNHPTPYWWLAVHGYTNDFETAVTAVGTNNIPVWQSYIAGLNPSDPESQLWLAGQAGLTGVSYVLHWNTVTDRVYTIWSSTNLAGGFAPLPGASNLPWTIQSFTNAVDSSLPTQFYRIEVQKP